MLATRLAHMRRRRNLHKLLITSSVVDEGKSVVASNLALTLARRSGERVLLIEADLRRPSITRTLLSSPLRGIREWNQGKLALADSLYRIGDLPVWVLAAGHPMDEPLPLLESDRFAKMLDSVGQSFDWVLLDATPLLPMADSTSIARLCDGVLVVVRDGYTRKKVLNKAIGNSRQVQASGRGLQSGVHVERQLRPLLRRVQLLRQIGERCQEGGQGSQEERERSQEAS